MLERVQNFHQICEGVCDTKKSRKHQHSKSSKSLLEIFCLPGSLPNEVENHEGFFSFPTVSPWRATAGSYGDLLPQDWQWVFLDPALTWLRSRARGVLMESVGRSSGSSRLQRSCNFPYSFCVWGRGWTECSHSLLSSLGEARQYAQTNRSCFLPYAPSLGKEQDQEISEEPQLGETRHWCVMQRER